MTMHFDLKQAVRAVTACVLTLAFAVPTNLMAEAHVVSPADLPSMRSPYRPSWSRGLTTGVMFRLS